MVHNARAASFDRILPGTKWISGDVDFDIDECGEEHNAYNHEDTSVWNMPANNANFD
jgi:hypothetical protein